MHQRNSATTAQQQHTPSDLRKGASKNLRTKELKNIVEEEVAETDLDTIRLVVSYLNQKCGTRYLSTTESTKRHIRARLNDGFVLEDFRAVIDTKHDDWSGTEYAKFLRPETLFGSKFEGYLNARPKQKEVEW